jgi:phospholipase C
VRTKRILPLAGGSLAIAAAAAAIGLSGAQAGSSPVTPSSTPIKHVVVIFGENESFDHYFGTYPNAANVPGEPAFTPKSGTPAINGLNATLETANPNAANPQRLDRSQAVTCGQNHAYGAEQKAFDGGLMDKFVENTAGGSCVDKSIVMDYYDGNTVTGLWNLAQNFSLNDNSFSTGFGPSTPGALNLISGNTHGATPASQGTNVENGSVINDPNPDFDDCSTGGVHMASRVKATSTTPGTGGNVGDLMSEHHVTWGWFQGGFRPTATVAGKAVCGATHNNVAGQSIADYSAHHEPFEYYATTANIHHVAPASAAAIGQDDPSTTPADQRVNHQYDLTDFDTALENGNLPQVSFLKAAAFEDAHPGNSDPLDEQRFVARTLDALEQSPDWDSTAVILAYDDSDGWYDHVMSPILNPSAAGQDALNGAGICGNVKDATAYADRCGYGPRQPLLVVSPWAKRNFVDNTLTDQTSVLKFIEDNWQLGRIGDQSMDAKAGSLGNMFDFNADHTRAPKVFLDPTTGLVTTHPPATAVSPDGTPTSTYTAPASGLTSSTDTTTPGTDKSEDNAAPAANSELVATPTAAPGVAGASTTPKAAPLKVSLSCKTNGRGHSVSVSCTAKGTGVSKVTALRFRVLRSTAILATKATRLKGTKASATLHVKTALKKGTYTLRVTVTQAGVVTATNKKVHLG